MTGANVSRGKVNIADNRARTGSFGEPAKARTPIPSMPYLDRDRMWTNIEMEAFPMNVPCHMQPMSSQGIALYSPKLHRPSPRIHTMHRSGTERRPGAWQSRLDPCNQAFRFLSQLHYGIVTGHKSGHSFSTGTSRPHQTISVPSQDMS